VIKVIKSLYEAGSAQVDYAGLKSKCFKLTQGVRQGSILSPFLYNIYTNQLLNKVQNINVGTVIYNTPTCITLYADDIILLSTTIRGLQDMKKDCVQFGYENCIKFNSGKTEFIISVKSSFKNITLNIDGQVIEPKDSLKHLGFHWKTNKT
jgi:hypothetical protein